MQGGATPSDPLARLGFEPNMSKRIGARRPRPKYAFARRIQTETRTRLTEPRNGGVVLALLLVSGEERTTTIIRYYVVKYIEAKIWLGSVRLVE